MKDDLFDWSPPERRTRTDQLLDAFAKFHAQNPNVWVLFQRFALDAIASGRTKYSSDCVCHRIRWHTDIETKGADLKINDHHTAYYARLFHLTYPQHDGFFRNRRLTSENDKAYDDDIQVFDSGPPGEEEKITKRLTEILNPQ